MKPVKGYIVPPSSFGSGIFSIGREKKKRRKRKGRKEIRS